MIRGTTPKHEFKTNINNALIDKLKIVYSQNDKEIVTKTKEDCTLSGDNIISTTLSQEETFLFSDKLVDIQLRIKTLGGEVLATEPISVDVRKCLDSEVL